MNDVPAPLTGPGPLALPVHSLPATLTPAGGLPRESQLLHYWRIVYRHRWLVAAIVAGSMLLAAAASALMQRQYTATATVQVSRTANKVVKLEGFEEDAAPYDQEFYLTQYELLKSRSLAEAVARSLRLAEHSAFLAGFDDGNRAEMAALPRDKRLALATQLVRAGTRVDPIVGSSIVAIRFTSPDRALAATIANGLAENYIETSLARRYEASSYAREFLGKRLETTRQKLEESERKAAEYARAKGLIKVTGDGTGAIEANQTLASADLTQLSSQLALARAARIQAEADYRANRGGSAAATALSNNAVNVLRQQRGELTAELTKLRSDFGPEYPRVVALSAQIAELDRQIDREQGRVESSIGRQLADRYAQALANERQLQSRVDGLKGDVLNQQRQSIGLNIIQRDVDTNRALYEALLQRYKEVGIAGGVGTNNISIVDRALEPTSPSRPNLPLNLMLGLLFGLALSGGTLFVREQLADAMILPDDFQRKLGVPLLGTTPKIRDGEPLEQLAEERSPLAEAYFSALTSIQFSTARGTPESLLVTSSLPSEGKSVTAFALARSLAQVGARVLLVDADMRNPSVHRLARVANETGLSDLLVRRRVLADVLRPSGIEGLTLVTSGPIPPNPVELLSSDTLEGFIDEALQQFDHIVFDGPPILGLADAPILSRATESTVFVVEAGRTRAAQARLALGRLQAVKARIIGAVLAKLDATASGYGYGYGYQYRYGSGQ